MVGKELRPQRCKYTRSYSAPKKAAIILSNGAAGSSLFSDAPRSHRVPFSLIYCLWEAKCAEKETPCSHRLPIDVPFSFVSTRSNGQVSDADCHLLLAVGSETPFAASTFAPFSSAFHQSVLHSAALQGILLQ